jgi:uncharacterized membrane protein YkvI
MFAKIPMTKIDRLPLRKNLIIPNFVNLTVVVFSFILFLLCRVIYKKLSDIKFIDYAKILTICQDYFWCKWLNNYVIVKFA